MTLHIGTAEQRTPEWYDERRGMVTASVVNRLLSFSKLGAIDYDCPGCGAVASESCRSKVKRAGEVGAPVKTPHPERTAVAVANEDDAPLVIQPASNDYSHALTAQLVAERITGHTDDVYVSAAMWRGVEDEPRAVDAYSRWHAPVTASNFMWRDDWGLSIGFSPDGLVGDDGLIEIKSRESKKQVLTFIADEVPVENMAQLQCGLLVSGRAWIDYVSFTGGMPLYVKRVFPDADWQDAIVAAVEQFETTAAEMVSAYTRATKGLPITERPDLEMSI